MGRCEIIWPPTLWGGTDRDKICVWRDLTFAIEDDRGVWSCLSDEPDIMVTIAALSFILLLLLLILLLLLHVLLILLLLLHVLHILPSSSATCLTYTITLDYCNYIFSLFLVMESPLLWLPALWHIHPRIPGC